MSIKAEAKESRFDALKWLVVVVLVAVGVVANHYFAAQSILYRVVGLLVLAAIAAFVALQTAKGQAFFGLLKDARTEIRKVVWPTRQETTQTTLIVVAVVLVMALLLWGLDSLLGWLVSTIVG
ncbi:preprotein translocase subunit SecE [Pseudomonas sp. HR1]|jgi:preprotein translocase subunit SecE|uniref:Protein translocase subunit SecE n=3 Tax=Pseudomonadaceae TaxID=135621 RepID=A0A1G5PIN8_9PSED|nr:MULTISPECIES: preprotein translocase subunit SecE [Pseudomonas]KIZ52247.1 preprotein translocase subunit SecE [Pseudomonas oryzihabitans]KTT52040.1 preprotein translocase subunit SecE [Pseudomonas psychrotolerans]MBA1258353.1 preprotein translocase subunit SecE [Pseudomonas psychrotolerans]MBH3329422.1 preprotein translocase subunit SecE [Pseudomonas oryzihabitans]MCI1011885.1 preprotein translocase subunit SecE [Pseudomonas oryzihabitans]